ncbi:MAG: hypothetical protein H8E14_09175 [Candidatus Marinimicrobia bacterium]|nr:hypothetical protein [Candidatus Neomarinimicrobiota bacterium]
MEFSKTVDVSRNLVYVKCSGELIIDEFLEQMNQIEEDPLFDIKMNILTDFSKMTIKKDYSVIVKLILYVLKDGPRHKGCKWALVYPETIDQSMIRLYEAISNYLDLLSQSFTTSEEAEAWVLDSH